MKLRQFGRFDVQYVITDYRPTNIPNLKVNWFAYGFKIIREKGIGGVKSHDQIACEFGTITVNPLNWTKSDIQICTVQVQNDSGEARYTGYLRLNEHHWKRVLKELTIDEELSNESNGRVSSAQKWKPRELSVSSEPIEVQHSVNKRTYRKGPWGTSQFKTFGIESNSLIWTHYKRW